MQEVKAHPFEELYSPLRALERARDMIEDNPDHCWLVGIGTRTLVAPTTNEKIVVWDGDEDYNDVERR